MKKLISLILVLALLFSLGVTASAAGQRIEPKELYYRGISIYVNGTELIPQDVNGNSTEPFIIEGTTYLPVRALAGALGLEVGWDGSTNTITLSSGAEVSMGIGRAAKTSEIFKADVYYKDVKIYLDGAELIPMDVTGKVVEPFLMGGSTYLPLRAIATALGLEVSWDEETNTITLNKPEEQEMVWRLVKQTTSTTMGAETLAAETEYLYDEAGRFLGMFSSLNEFRIIDMSCTYGSDGRLSALSLLTEDMGLELSFTFDSAHRPASISAAMNGEFLAKLSYEYDLQGRVSKEIAEAADGSKTTGIYSYTENPEVTAVNTYDQQQNELWSRQTFRDAGGNLLRQFTRYADGSSEEALWTYDIWGRLETYTYTSAEHRYTYKYSYDSEGREISCTAWVDGDTITTATEWSVDGLSCRITTTTPDGASSTESRIFSADGRLLRSIVKQDGATVTTEYEYALYPCSGEDDFLTEILGALGYSK